MCGRTRREFFWETGAGFTGLALTSLLSDDGFFDRHLDAESGHLDAENRADSLAPKPQQFPTRAKSCIFLFMNGGPPHMDLFDYKPELQRQDGRA